MNFLQTSLISILSFAALFLIFWKFIFLRNPKRVIPKGKNIVSAADGKVIDIIKFDGKSEITFFKNNKRYLGIVNTLTKEISKKGYLVSVFMNPLNVHYNRAPIAGKVISVKQTKGKLLPVNTVQAGLVNTKAETVIKGDLTIKVVQIAGLLASKVYTYKELNQNVDKGEIIGLINLGSQVTLVLPYKVRINVKKGDKVKAGETIMGEY